MADTPDPEVVSKKSLLERLTLPHGSYSTGEYIIPGIGLAEEDSGHPMEVEGAPVDAHSLQPSQSLTFASFKFSASFSASSKDVPSLLQRMHASPLIEPTGPSPKADRPDEEKRDIGDSEVCLEGKAPLGGTFLPSDSSALLNRISPNAPESFEPQSRKCEDPPAVHQPLTSDHNPDLLVSRSASPNSSIVVYDPPIQSGGGEASNPVSPVFIGKEISPECIITSPPDDLSAAVEGSTHTEPSPGASVGIDLVRPNFFAPTFQEILSTLSQEKIHAISASFEKPNPVMPTLHDSGTEKNEVIRELETAFGPSPFEDLFTEIAIEQSEWIGLRSNGAISASQNADLEDQCKNTAQSEDHDEPCLTVNASAPLPEQCAVRAKSQQITEPNTGPRSNPDDENLGAAYTPDPVAQDTRPSNPLPTSPTQISSVVTGHNSNHCEPLSSSRVVAPSARQESFIPLKPMAMTTLASLPPSRPLAESSGEQFEWVSTSRPIITEELPPLSMVVWPHFSRRLDDFESQELSKAVTITRAALYGNKRDSHEVSRHSPPSSGAGNPPAKRRKLFLSSRSPSSSPSIPLIELQGLLSVSPVKIEHQADDVLLNEERAVSQDLKHSTASGRTRGVHSRRVSPLRKKCGSPWPAGSRADRDYLDGLREAEALTDAVPTESVVDQWVVIGSEGSLGDEDAEGSTEEDVYEHDELAEDNANPTIPSIPPAQTSATIHSTSRPLSQDAESPKPTQPNIEILAVAPMGPVSTVPKRAASTNNIAGSTPRVPMKKLVQQMSPHSTTPSGSTLPSNHVEPLDRNRKRSWIPPDPGVDAANKRIKTAHAIELEDHQSSTQTNAKVQEDSLQVVSDVSPSGSGVPSRESSADPIALVPFGSSMQSRSDRPSRGRSVIRSGSTAYRGSYRPRSQRIVDSYVPRYPLDDHQHSQSRSQRHNSQPHRRSRSPSGKSSRYVLSSPKTTPHAQTIEVSRRARTPPLPRAPSLVQTPMRIATSHATDRGHSYLDRRHVPSRHSYSPPRGRSPSRRSRSPIRNPPRHLRRTSPARSQDTMNSVHDTQRSEEGNRKTLRRSSSPLPRDREHVPSSDDGGIDSSDYLLRGRSSSTRKLKSRGASPESTRQKDGHSFSVPNAPHTESFSESPLVGRDLSPLSATFDPMHSNLRDNRALKQVSPSMQTGRRRLSPRDRDELPMSKVTSAPAKIPVKPAKAITLVERIQPSPSRASTSASASPALLDRMRQPLQSSPPPTSPPYQSKSNNRSALASANEPSLWQRMNDVSLPLRSATNPSQTLYDDHRSQSVGPAHGMTYQPESRNPSSQPQGSALIDRIGLSPPMIRARGRGRGTGRGTE